MRNYQLLFFFLFFVGVYLGDWVCAERVARCCIHTERTIGSQVWQTRDVYVEHDARTAGNGCSSDRTRDVGVLVEVDGREDGLVGCRGLVTLHRDISTGT